MTFSVAGWVWSVATKELYTVLIILSIGSIKVKVNRSGRSVLFDRI